MSDDPLALMAKLKRRITTTLARRGLALETLALLPGDQPDDHRVHLVVTAIDGWEPDRDADTEAAFEDVLRSAHRAERDHIADESRQELQALHEKLTRDEGGFL